MIDSHTLKLLNKAMRLLQNVFRKRGSSVGPLRTVSEFGNTIGAKQVHTQVILEKQHLQLHENKQK